MGSTSLGRTACHLFAVSSMMLGCASGSTPPKLEAADTLDTAPVTRYPSGFDETCSIEPGASAAGEFNQDRANQVLAAAHAKSACATSPAGEPLEIAVEWGPSGCVRSVSIFARQPPWEVEQCYIRAYGRARIPAFSGRYVTVHTVDGTIKEVSHRLSPALLQKFVSFQRSHFGACYAKGLARNPKLTGRVSVGFTISEAGAVSQVHDADSDLADRGVIACILRAFTQMRFPTSDNGITTVVYPIMLEPS